MSDPLEGVNFDAFGEHDTDHSDRSMYDVAISALMKRDEKIKRLEAELAEMRRTHMRIEDCSPDLATSAELEAELAACEQVREATASESRDRYAELADLRASSVVVRERCETCDGSGVPVCPKHGDGNHPDCALKTDCPNCTDGWRLAEGVERVHELMNSKEVAEALYRVDPHAAYVIPVRLIEGEG